MGAVFLAEDAQLKRRPALKIIDSSVFGQTESIRRFEREAISASKISHPNVAHIYEFGRDGKFLFPRNGIRRRKNLARTDQGKKR